MRVLIIEDDPLIRTNIVETLGFQGYETLEAENGWVGIQLARESLPDLIISDIMMPEMDGYEVLMQLRNDPGTAHIPFIFTTARIDRSSIRRGMDLGADDYLTKPFTVNDLLSSVTARLRKQASLIQEYEQKLAALRSQLLSSLPHELRTPLTGILGYAELIVQDGETLDRAKIVMMAQKIHKSGQRLYHLIENYLLYAQIEILRTDPERVRGLQNYVVEQPDEIIREIVDEKAEYAGRANDLRLEITPVAPVMVAGDSLRKIVGELVDNALKFSAESTLVEVRVYTDETWFFIDVLDHGRGMTREQINGIALAVQFDRKIYEQQGFGLGLIIAKRLVELHRGELHIESVPEEFTRVRVALPLKSMQG